MSQNMRTLTVSWVHVWADNLRDSRKATLTYTRATYPSGDLLAFTDSEALHEMLGQIDPSDSYMVRFHPATKKEIEAARVPLSFDLSHS